LLILKADPVPAVLETPIIAEAWARLKLTNAPVLPLSPVPKLLLLILIVPVVQLKVWEIPVTAFPVFVKEIPLKELPLMFMVPPATPVPLLIPIIPMACIPLNETNPPPAVATPRLLLLIFTVPAATVFSTLKMPLNKLLVFTKEKPRIVFPVIVKVAVFAALIFLIPAIKPVVAVVYVSAPAVASPTLLFNILAAVNIADS
jgi:hypothetical protein